MNFQKRYVFALGLTALLSASMPVGAQQPKAVQTAIVTLD